MLVMSVLRDRLAFVRYDVPVGGVSKRFFDILISVLLLILLAPLMLGLAMLILTTSKGSAFFGHERIGYENRRFQCLKFRTMVIDGDAVLKSHCARNPEALREWTENRKLSSDPRVTPVGQVLRKLSLDELPQLVNVVRGEIESSRTPSSLAGRVTALRSFGALLPSGAPRHHRVMAGQRTQRDKLFAAGRH